jgi:hypothetical protein
MQLEWLSIYYRMYDGMNVLTVDMKIWPNRGNESVRVNVPERPGLPCDNTAITCPLFVWAPPPFLLVH